MSDSSLRLHFRYGNEIEQPTHDSIAQAIAEVFNETHPQLSESDYAEHPNAWIQFGYESGDNWTVITLDLYRSGRMRYSFWADQDDDEPEREASIENVTEDQANELFQLLANIKHDAVVAAFAAT